MKLTPVGMDIAKMVFQVHHVDETTGEIVNKPIKREKFLDYFVNRSPLTQAKEPGPWVEQIKQRRPANVAIVALVNKMARTIWAVLANGRAYRKGHVSVKLA